MGPNEQWVPAEKCQVSKMNKLSQLNNESGVSSKQAVSVKERCQEFKMNKGS